MQSYASRDSYDVEMTAVCANDITAWPIGCWELGWQGLEITVIDVEALNLGQAPPL